MGSHPSARTHTHGSRIERWRVPIIWGLVFGGIQAASPLAFRWIDSSTFHALSIALIAAIYIGFAVADGRPNVIAVECVVALLFVVLAAAGVTGSAWLLVIGYAGHGLKDAWQEHRQFVSTTRWWPPFCATVDFLVAAILIIEIAAGVDFHQ
jgi:hypothetical protein